MGINASSSPRRDLRDASSLLLTSSSNGLRRAPHYRRPQPARSSQTARPRTHESHWVPSPPARSSLWTQPNRPGRHRRRDAQGLAEAPGMDVSVFIPASAIRPARVWLPSPGALKGSHAKQPSYALNARRPRLLLQLRFSPGPNSSLPRLPPLSTQDEENDDQDDRQDAVADLLARPALQGVLQARLDLLNRGQSLGTARPLSADKHI